MKTTTDIWDTLGELQGHELIHAMTKLFSIYEEKLKKNPADDEALNFFKHLDIAISQTQQCNLNRR